jgi:ArsR family transcriptional regulator, arsenate/arsenite/antimonite-responsive transcriptional repressor
MSIDDERDRDSDESRNIRPERQAEIFAALADPLRVRFVRELADNGECSGKTLASRLGISLALLSHHSKILVASGLVRKRKAGQTTYYSEDRSILKSCVNGLL